MKHESLNRAVMKTALREFSVFYSRRLIHQDWTQKFHERVRRHTTWSGSNQPDTFSVINHWEITVDRRVALITDTKLHLGPDLARILAKRGHDLVLGDPQPGLIEEVQALGANVVSLRDMGDLADGIAIARLITAGLERFGRLDAACVRTGKIIGGGFMDANLKELRSLQAVNQEAVFHCLQALLRVMVPTGQGQIIIVTSATGRRPLSRAMYAATRAGANMMVKAAALEVADKGVCVNALGTAFLDYPGFIKANGCEDPDVRKTVEARVPMKRFGQPAEVAHFAASLLDGDNRFQTGQFFSLSGGWSD
jgi:3-oxoacyl-[acyl-carrier protein] reductase